VGGTCSGDVDLSFVARSEESKKGGGKGDCGLWLVSLHHVFFTGVWSLLSLWSSSLVSRVIFVWGMAIFYLCVSVVWRMEDRFLLELVCRVRHWFVVSCVVFDWYFIRCAGV
jgi:hypothetical protein